MIIIKEDLYIHISTLYLYYLFTLFIYLHKIIILY